MADKKLLIFKCLNPECGKVIKMYRPEKSGIYKVTCPYCKTEKKMRLTGLDQVGQEEKAQTPAAPDNSQKPPVVLPDDFIVGETYEFTCPHCGKQRIGITPQKPGARQIPCPLCKGQIKLTVRNKTDVVELELQPAGDFVRGKLTLLRKGWFNKDYPLGEGSHTVGRYDDSDMAEIAVKNDPTMSRRSVVIDVRLTPAGYTFKLTVLRAANPVLHNGAPLLVGDSVSLNFGDTIVLGRTKFRFDKDTK